MTRLPRPTHATTTPEGTMSGFTPCAYEGCTLTTNDNIAVFRVNPTGQKGIFMCAPHARIVDAPPRPPRW